MSGFIAQRAPRFVFLSDAPPTGRSDPRAAGPKFGWRLVAANNRPLGRGTTLSDSEAECQASARAVRNGMASLETVVTADTARGMWKWRGSLAGVPVVTSAHAYVRRVECARGLAQFILALERAQPDAGIVRHFGARSLREYENEPAFSMHYRPR